MEKQFRIGLVKGRHDIPEVTSYVFEEILDVTDVRGMEKQARDVLRKGMFEYMMETRDFKENTVHLYVTGLTVALGAVVAACLELGLYLVLYHYNRDTGEYYAQPVICYQRE